MNNDATDTHQIISRHDLGVCDVLISHDVVFVIAEHILRNSIIFSLRSLNREVRNISAQGVIAVNFPYLI